MFRNVVCVEMTLFVEGVRYWLPRLGDIELDCSVCGWLAPCRGFLGGVGDAALRSPAMFRDIVSRFPPAVWGAVCRRLAGVWESDC